MKISTFEEDLLGLEDFANRLDKFISIEQNFVEGGLVVALSAKFGFGKTTFLEMWSSSLKNAEKKEDKPLIISLNAWESDYCGDPLYAIVSALVECIREEEGGEEVAKKLIDAVKKIGGLATELVVQVIKKNSGIDIGKICKGLGKDGASKDTGLKGQADAFSVYESRKNAMGSLKSAIQGYVRKNESRKILFLVDELDRCRPDYAISYLETIKHIFDIKGVVFILAADREQLENSAKKAFGPELDFDEYYRKFIHREISLPDISDEHYKILVSKYVDYYLEREGMRSCVINLDWDRRGEINSLLGALKLTPRQIQEVFRILGHCCETTVDKKGRLDWLLAVATILMAALKIGKSEVFESLGNQTLEAKEAFGILKDLLGENQIEEVKWWFEFIFKGNGFKRGNNNNYRDILKEVGLPDADLSYRFSEWSRISTVDSSKFIDIYNKIEQIFQWG